MLSTDWSEKKTSYDVIVVGSGYGGAIAAARLASAELPNKLSVCVLERGREWPIRKFPDTPDGFLAELRSDWNPLGLYELINFDEITVLKGSGLGGTSLINANVAVVPDREAFDLPGWPASLAYDELLPYYERARDVLSAGPHPKAKKLKKVQALDRRARQLGLHAEPLNIAVNFKPRGFNKFRVFQKECQECGDCTTGCNHGAKNTLYMNYLPMAKKAGAVMFTQTAVEHVEKLANGKWRVHGKHHDTEHNWIRKFTMEARVVVLAAGALNTTEILLRSGANGLALTARVGTSFTSNGDFFGLSYNGENATQVLGFGRRPESPRTKFPPGPAIVSAIHYNPDKPVRERFTFEDLSFPSAFVDAAKPVFAGIAGEPTENADPQKQRQRVLHDLDPTRRKEQQGAMNHSMLFLVIGFDNAAGRIVLETTPGEPEGKLKVIWPEAGNQPLYEKLNEEIRLQAVAHGASFISNPLWSAFNLRRLMTAHPLGGCPIGADASLGAVDEFGRVFSPNGGVHDGLFVADGSLMGFSIGVNPFLTVSALAEKIVERKIRELQGDPYP